MQRFSQAIGWLIDAMGKYPVEDGIAFYRDIEFPLERELDRPVPIHADEDDREAMRLAS